MNNPVTPVLNHLKPSFISPNLQMAKPDSKKSFFPKKPSCRRQMDHATAAQDRLMRSGDVEENPGPRDPQVCSDATVLVTSYNIRGLNDEKKLRHLINKVYKDDKGKNFDSIICLQETFITNAGKIPYLWRGNLHLTPGTGSSCGCITLTSPHLNITHAVDIEGRAHVLACSGSGGSSYIVANIYAPNPNNGDKIDFYDRIFDTVSELSVRFNCLNILMAGDFNLIFDVSEAKNRQYSAQEKRVVEVVKSLMEPLHLTDSWREKSVFTWKRPNSNIFSTIDRVLYSRDTIELVDIKANWSYSFSDHAAVRAKYKIKNKNTLRRSKITRLDPSLAKCPQYKTLIESGFNTMLETMPTYWNPHLKLEFAKMCIRTVVEGVQAFRKV